MSNPDPVIHDLKNVLANLRPGFSFEGLVAMPDPAPAKPVEELAAVVHLLTQTEAANVDS